MRLLKYIIILLIMPASLAAQQFPFLEGYNINPFSLSPAYAGIENADYLFSDYRTDWTGIEGGPVTCQLSYNTRFMENVGIGGKFIYDKTDIFRQTLIMGTYAYKVEIFEDHLINLALSAGGYRNSIDLAKYFNEPDYVIDAVLISGLEKSKFKFATDMAALYQYGPIEGGILFSNLMFGPAKYNNPNLSYRPMRNFLVHASYKYDLNELVAIKPFVMVRGGQNAPAYLEIAPQVKYRDMLWGTVSYRTGGVWGLGFGAEVIDGLIFNYSYNISSGIAMNVFGSHQLNLGVRLVDLPSFSGVLKTDDAR